jgi:hypothetical protein
VDAVPEEVVQHYCSLYYKECLSQYLKAKLKHRQVCAEVDTANRKRSYEISMNLVGSTPLLKPAGPTLRLFTQHRLFDNFMTKAFKEKDTWPMHVKEQQRARRASMLRVYS